MSYSGIIFDVDGTLLDSIQDLADSMNFVLSRHGFPVHDIEKYKQFVGNGMRVLAISALPEEERDEEKGNRYLDELEKQYEKRWNQGHEINLKVVDGVRYTVPCTVNPQRMENTQVVRFRVGNVYKNCYIGVYFDDEQVMHRKRPVMAPGEMEEIKLEKEKLLLHPELKTITIKVEEA